MNISENTIKELNELYSVTFVDKYINEVNPVNSTHLLIGFLLDENKKLAYEIFDYLIKTYLIK